ncbi:hypothetical protein GDO86_012830 [Hymenochirus boettgeri]|uniref:Uncharacterized protein n=1 Tax=Hymenochirus boettgeri TaxID=247094 RepID=A0A8T2INR3_9PIPI|nr:hypothetical protein GDO86_012830 [Hymenochirus boettgeri]
MQCFIPLLHPPFKGILSYFSLLCVFVVHMRKLQLLRLRKHYNGSQRVLKSVTCVTIQLHCNSHKNGKYFGLRQAIAIFRLNGPNLFS